MTHWTRTKPGKTRCIVGLAQFGPLFANSRCTGKGDWNVAGQPHVGPLCLHHMLDRLEERRQHAIGVDGHGKHEKPSLCGGYTYCLPDCGAKCRDWCRAKAEPRWLHIHVALMERRPRRWRRRELLAARRASRA